MSTEIRQGYRLSPQQRHLWLQQVGSELYYYAQGGILVEGGPDARLLKAALKRVIGEHEALRTVFHNLPGMRFPAQVVTDIVPPIDDHDLTGMTVQAQREKIEALFQEDRRRPFDFERGPLLRASYLVLSSDTHLLLLTLSALCADAVTLNNLAHEISRAYVAEAGSGHAASDAPMQYADLSEWQNEILETEYSSEGREFWREQELSSLSALKLPLEKISFDRSKFDPQSLSLTLKPELLAKIETISRSCESSAEVFLLTCWQVLLRYLTGRNDIVVGVLYGGRNYCELEDALGLFAKYLPVPCHLSDDSHLDEALRAVEQFTQEARRWQECFSWEELRAAQDDSIEPSMFPFSFDFITQPAKRLAAGLSFSVYKPSVCLDRFKVKLSCLERGDTLATELHYDAGLISAEYAERLLAQYHMLAESAADNPQAAIERLEILGAAEREQLLLRLNDTQATYSEEKCVHELFESIAARQPERMAVVFEEQCLTYGELNTQANRLAHHLRALGVGPEARVGLFVKRSLNMIVGLLGILKAGGAYVPLESEQPRARLAQQLAEAGVGLLLTEHRLSSNLPEFSGTVLCLDSDEQRWTAGPESNPLSGSTSLQLAYVIYTSGSTGVPKAVGVTHRNLVNYTEFIIRKIGARELLACGDLAFATVTTLSADLGHTSIFGALLSGGCLHVIGYEVATDGERMATYMTAHAVDVLKVVPSHLSALLSAGGGARALPRRWLILGGEAFSVELAQRIKELKGEWRILNHYGPTEATVGALTYAGVDNEDAWRERLVVPIGRPIANAQVYILDRQMMPVATGVVGELYLGGAGLARGYLNSAEQTAERFVPHPLARTSGERLYRTGDLARFLVDGNIEFVGRIDEQVKIRGYRIEPGEVASILKEHEAVKEAVVLVREDEPKRKRLVAYVVPKAMYAPTVSGRLRYRLPNNLAVVQQNKYETDFFYRQIFVEQTNLKHGIHLPPRACVFDVGANIGLFTLYASMLCKDATVYAFEPIPPIFETLKLNASVYEVNVKLYNCGLSNANRKVTFTYYPHSSCMSGYYADADLDRQTLSLILKQQNDQPQMTDFAPYLDDIAGERIKSEAFLCQLRTISEIITENSIECVDLLKIDVEKSELDVLQGIENEDWEKIRNIVIEAHDVNGQLERIRTLLEQRGYHVIVEQDMSLDRTGLFNIYAKREQSAAEEETPSGLPPSIAHPASVLTNDELLTYLQSRLPAYMLPGDIIILESLPLTANGKLNRQALPSPEESRSGDIEYAPPRNEIENILVSVWQEVLDRAPIGINSDYFALGGDSIRVVQIVHELNQYDLPVMVMDILRHSTISKIALHIQESRAETEKSAPPPLDLLMQPEPPRALLPEGTEDVYPASKMQEYVIFHYQHDHQGMGVYHIQQSYHIYDKDFSPSAFKKALEIIVNRHAALRTTFMTSDTGEFFQVVRRRVEPSIREEQLRHLGNAEQEAHIEAAILRDRASLFDITKTEEPLVRFTIFFRAEDTIEFLMSIHHAIIDGWGNQVLAKELVDFYLALKRGEAAEAAPSANTYKEFVALEREIIGSKAASNFWREHLKISTDRLPPRRALPVEQDTESNYLYPLPRELTNRMYELSRSLKVSLKAIFLSGYLDLIGSETGGGTVTVGVISNGRSERLTEPLKAVGLFWNIIPFCCSLEGEDKLSQAGKVQRLLIETERYATYPLAQILKDQRTMALFFATFNFLHFHHMKNIPVEHGLRVLGMKSHDKFHFPLNYIVSVDPFNGNIGFRVEYDKSYFSHESIRSLTEQYVELLRSSY
jgi:amino acid adenylation domain-containing protein/FkbM family methyltransferase